jgi:uncharacterized SAM-binding protein YcdF (DUF218 family)
MKWLLKRFPIFLVSGVVIWLVGATLLIAGGMRERIEPADLAVVLGNEVYPSGEPSPQLKVRLDRTFELYRQGLFSKILVSGGIEENGVDEALGMQRNLIKRGIPSTAILLDKAGNNTRATARNAAAIAKQNGWTRILIISHCYHLPRCRLAFARAGIQEPLSSYPRVVRWQDFVGISREMLAYPAYLF